MLNRAVTCVSELSLRHESGAFPAQLGATGDIRTKIMFSNDLRLAMASIGKDTFVALPREERTKIF